jgi:tRNA(Ile)-lysidine synthase
MSTRDQSGVDAPDAFAAKLRAVLDEWAAARAPSRITIAFSGGLDSTVLLASLSRLKLAVPLRAAHVDHGLHPRSAEWREHCARVAGALGVELVATRVAVDRESGEGLEAAARDARYAALRAMLSPDEWLLTAHHADDQLETVLLRMVRGTGVRGLRGALKLAPLGAGWLGRPLLGFTRDELRAEAAARGLVWIEDPSNAEPYHDRNFLRLHVLPALRERWPAAALHAQRLAEQAADAEQLLEAVAGDDARALVEPWHVPRAVLEALAPARQRNLLRYLLRVVGLDVPSARKLEELRHALLGAHAESRARVCWPGGEGRVYRDALYLTAPLAPPPSPDFAARLAAGRGWAGPEGRLELMPAEDEQGLPQSWVEEGLVVRFRRGGERFRPRARGHRHSLRHLFQEQGVVPWMRDRVPLLYRRNEIAAIADLMVAADADGAPAGEPRWRVHWSGHAPVRAPERR